ncbi:MAG TPA: class I SAM-dependent methyltransferase family protein [Thermomicrobiales bacterium]|nr:class I SAM-dependent methyltransferase family protein [Thermomicrobiales bacterium]
MATRTAERTIPDAPKLDPGAPRWRVARAGLRLGALVSDGIALGYRHGFDSGPMLDYVYRNEARGKVLIGRLVDRVYLEQLGWRAIRARRALLERTLLDVITARRARGARTQIVDIAAGPGRYLLELVAATDRGDLAVLCRDLDPAGLAQGRALAATLGLAHARFERGDATDPIDLARIAPRPDLAVASGVYEIITDDAAIRRSMRGVRALLPDGGAFVFTTQIAHPQLDLIANTLPNRHGEPWVMGTRPIRTVEEWAREAGFAATRSWVAEHGLFAVTRSEK